MGKVLQGEGRKKAMKTRRNVEALTVRGNSRDRRNNKRPHDNGKR